MELTAKIRELLQDKFEEEEFLGCFIVEIKHLKTQAKMEIFIDHDENLNLGLCSKVNRYIRRTLEEEGFLVDDLAFEVSSPGLKKPLVLQRQYKKNIGRSLSVTLTDNTVREGVLKLVDETKILVEGKVREKVGKRKQTKIVESEIPFDLIKKTVVKISFK